MRWIHLSLLLLLPVPVAAQDVVQPSEKLHGLQDIALPEEPGAVRTLHLTVDDAMRLARSQNTTIKIGELRPLQFAQDVVVAQALFEPEMFVDAGIRRSKTVAQGAFQPATERETIDSRLGWRQRVVTGGLFELALTPVKFVQQQNAFFGRNDIRLWTSDLTVTYTQPLLRGGWTDYTLTGPKSAELLRAQADRDLERTVQDTLLAVVQAFWELVFAQENYRAIFAAGELAAEQLRITEERIRVRELAERDRVTDEAEVAKRREELIAARNDIFARADDLRRLLLQDADGELWTTQLVPASPIDAPLPEVAPDWRVPARVALRERPDLAALRSAASAAELRERAAATDLLPQLDFVGSYGNTGAGSSFNESLSGVWDLEQPDWSLRLQLSVPVGNSAARASFARSRLVTEEARRTLYAAETDTVKDVRDSVRALTTSAERVRASRESVRLAETELDTAQRKYRVGELTPFDVQLRNQSLLEARNRLLRNQLDFRIAEARLLYAQGLLGREPKPE